MVTQTQLSSIYCINMQSPAGGAANSMWTSYSSSAMLAAFQNAAALGFNTVRIVLLPSTFGFPSPSGALLAHLTDTCNQALIAGVKLHITLLWFWVPTAELGQVNGTKTYMTAMMGAVLASNLPVTNSLTTTGAIFEIYNEGRYGDTTDNYAGTYDGGYPGSTTPPQTLGTVTTNWASVIIPWLRTLPTSGGGGGFSNSTNCLVTISCTNVPGTPGSVTDLTAAVASLTGTSAPDWWEWHSYPYGGVPGFMTDMNAAKSAVNGAPLFIGETGGVVSGGVNNQKNYIQNARYTAQTLGLGEPAPWVIYDPGGVVITDTYGFYDMNGAARPVVALYQALPPGSNVPMVGSDRWFGTAPSRQRIAAGVEP
jgi:hypothetical protein